MIRIFSAEEIAELEEATRMDTCGLLVKLVVHMGLRHGEGLELKVGDYDFSSNTLSIRGANPRSLTVPEEMRFPLMRLIHGRAEEAYVVSTCPSGSRPLGARTFQAYLNRTAERLGLRGVTVINLRATCIVRKLQNGVDPNLIQKELGIRARKSIMKYREMAPAAVLTLPVNEVPTLSAYEIDRQAVGQ